VEKERLRRVGWSLKPRLVLLPLPLPEEVEVGVAALEGVSWVGVVLEFECRLKEGERRGVMMRLWERGLESIFRGGGRRK
jgi:hypothetical protein